MRLENARSVNLWKGMMSGRWWRAYSRARHDPKLLKLTDKDFRWWFNFLCVASENGGRLPFVRDLAAEFRTTEHAISVALDRLRVVHGLFEIEGEPGPDVVYVPHNWNVLQYVSDSSSNRVKQFRERQRNVSVTPSESETEAETEREVAQPRSRTGSRLPEDWMPSDEDRAFAEQHGKNPHAIAPSFRDYWHGVAGAKGRKADWSATWRNWVRREADSTKTPPKVNGFSKPDPQALPAAEPWEQRMYGWTKSNGKFWQSTWGPKPGENGCRVPASLLASH
jgi:hypothetical protein